MVNTERLSRSDIQRSRKYFWVFWTLLIAMPANMTAFMFSYGSLWVSILAVIISTVLGYNLFEFWLRRRQERATNTIVLCQCAHTEGVHHDTLGLCQHYDYQGPRELGSAFYRCLCSNYTPRFWQMARRI